MVDLHVHILPGLDDGSQSMEESLELAELALEGGVSLLAATPHSNQEGRFEKMIPQCGEITFNGEQALKQGQEVVFITERAVFRLTKDGVMLTEIAPGVDLERDVIAQMGFRPLISDELKLMDERIFRDEPMGIHDEFMNA